MKEPKMVTRATAAMRLGAFAILTVALGVADASASLIAYDGFDYTVGATVKTQDGGTGDWDKAWGGDAELVVESGSLLFTDSFGDELDTSGHHVGLTTGGATKNVTRALVNSLGVITETIWASVMLDGSSGSSLNNFVLGKDGLYIGQGGGVTTSTNWRLTEKGGASADTGISADSTAFLLTRVDFVAGGGETAWLWVDPDLDAEPTTASADATLSATSFVMDKVKLQLTDTTAGIDEVRIGYDWGSVAPRKVPEPGTAVLLGLGLSGLALHARDGRRRCPRAQAASAAPRGGRAARA